MDEWRTSVLQLKPEDTMLVICHSKNTFDKRVLLEKTNPTMKKLSIKMRRLVKDKTIANFYLSLKDDFKAEDASGATIAYTAEDLNPALQFTDSSATTVTLPEELTTESPTAPELVMEELPDLSDNTCETVGDVKPESL